MPDPVIVARGVTKDYPFGSGAVHALRGVDLEIGAGEWVAIMGPSGSGKSTLLNLLAGIEAPTRGEVSLLGERLGALDEGARARLRLRSVGFVFQRFHLLPVLTALENVELPMAEAGLARRQRQERARSLLAYVGLESRMTHRPTQLSGGEQQRVAIARALANEPRVVFADEPTGELDQRTGEEVLDLLARLNRDGVTVVTVTHETHVAERARRRIEMADGKITAVVSVEP
jgi:putative ABC transport system ATP-binding protein